MSGPIRRGATSIIPEHGHTKRDDGGVLSASLFVGSLTSIPTAIAATTTGAITTANLLTSPPPGLYRVTVYVEVTAKSSNGTITVTIGWTDAVGATTDNTTLAVAVSSTTRFSAPYLCNIASGSLTYAVGIGTFAGTYTITLVAERIK